MGPTVEKTKAKSGFVERICRCGRLISIVASQDAGLFTLLNKCLDER